jgi:hypothetical protein
MHRIDGAGHVGNKWVAEDVSTLRPPTEITPEIMNALQEELAGLIEWAGIILSKGDNSQLKEAISALIQRQTCTAFSTTGISGAFALSPSPAITAYTAGQRFRVKFHAVGNGADQLNISALGNKALKQYDSTGAKVAAVVAANQLADVEYDGVDMVLLDPLPLVSAQGNFAGLNSSNVSATLGLSDMGKLYAFYGSAAAQTLTLPAVATIALGKNAIIVNQASVAVTVKANAAENIASNTAGVGQAIANTIILNPGDSISLSSNGGNQWNAYGFTSAGQFPNSKASNGYQKLPNGLIFQWMATSESASVGDVKAFPITFPNNCFAVMGSSGNIGDSVVVVSMATSGAVLISGTTYGASTIYVLAIGN